jgi:SAM-dependent methyltransferase
MDDPYAAKAARFLSHYRTLRGAVRLQLLARQLDAHMPPPPARIADVGGGAGHQAIPLARRGHEVVVLDPSEAMLEEARQALEDEQADVRGRIRLVCGWGEEAPRLLGERGFGAVLCHGVLPYVEEPAALLASLAAITAPGGLVSLLGKNAEALAMRAGLEGRWNDALAAFDADRDVGGMGVTTRGDTLAGLTRMLDDAGLEVEAWYGVRVFTDHLWDVPPAPGMERAIEAEWEAGRRDPYRRVARLVHVIARRG